MWWLEKTLLGDVVTIMSDTKEPLSEKEMIIYAIIFTVVFMGCLALLKYVDNKLNKELDDKEKIARSI